MKDADFNSWVKADAIADTIHFYCSEQAAALREPSLNYTTMPSAAGYSLLRRA
jgi:hypothetical protein